MPRYFFNVIDGAVSPDEDGVVFDSLDDARRQAIECAGEILKDLGRHAWNGPEWRMQVADETGKQVCELNFSTQGC